MKITYIKSDNISRFTTRYTTYAVYQDGTLIGYVENQKSGPYSNWKPFMSDRKTAAHPCVHGTRRDAVTHLIAAVEA